MATLSQRLLWTAVPDGVSEDGDTLRINVHISPRLEVADASFVTLDAFPAIADWATTVNAAELSVRINGVAVAAERGAPADAGVWGALFPPATPVRTRTREDFHKRRILTYPLAALAERVEREYAVLATDDGNELPRLDTLRRKVFNFAPSKQLGLQDLLAILDESETDDALAEHAISLLQAYHTPLDAPMVVKVDKRDEFDPHEATQYRSFARAPMPEIDELAARYDFHQRVSGLGQHTWLMRRAGLVIPVRVPRNGIAQGAVKLDVVAKWNTGSVPAKSDVYPVMQCLLDGEVFVAAPRGSLISNGWLRAGASQFALVALDVDGAGLSLKNFSTTLPRMREERLDDDDFGADRVARTGLPRLRTGAVQLAHRRRDRAIRALFSDANTLEDALEADAPIVLHAEDVIRGWRVEVAVAGTDKWRSLMRFDGQYTLVETGEVLSSEDEETSIQLAAGGSADGSNADVLKATEGLFAWSGWSLAAPEPGRAIMPDEITHAEAHGEAAPGLPLETVFRARKGSLPTLRFGREYVVRLRYADIAGGGVPWAPDATSPEGTIAKPVFVGRYEPVEAPSVSLIDGDPDPADGESMTRVALRSTDLAEHANDRARRRLSPPRVGQRFAEAHGVLDDANGRPDAARYAMLIDRDAPYTERVVETLAYVPEGSNDEPAVVHTAYATGPADRPTPYLYDPLAAGIAVRIMGLPDVDPEKVHTLPFGGDSWNANDTPPWPDGLPVVLEATSNGGIDWDPATRTLRIGLGKAERARVRVSSLVPKSGLAMFKLLERVRARVGAAQVNAVRELIADGQHWMFTPWHDVELVHAVQRPLVTPDFVSLGAVRAPGELSATLRYSTPIHSKSTVRLDVVGEWVEIDDTQPTGPTTRRVHATAFSRRYARLEVPDGAIKADLDQHTFADTRARRVFYTGIATTRHREFMPPELRADPDLLTVNSAPVRTWIPSSSPPPAPVVRYLVPTFGWQEGQSTDGTRQVWRRGGGLRVYLDRPWYASGPNEMLGVLLPRDTTADPSEAEEAFVTQWGADPVWSGGTFPTVAPSRTDFLRRVEAAPIPYDFVPTDPGDGTTPPDPAVEGADLDVSLRLEGVRPPGAPSGVTVDVVPHAVGYDAERALWFADIVVRPGTTYNPFIRLALARYQPRSAADCTLSQPVLASFQQLTPDRLATVTQLSGRRIRVQVYGRTPNPDTVFYSAAHVSIELQRLAKDADRDLDWRPVADTAPPSGVPPVTLPPGTRIPNTRVPSGRAPTGTRAPAPVPPLTPAIQTALDAAMLALERGDITVLTRHPELAPWFQLPLIHEQVLQLPAQSTDELRVLVTEAERYATLRMANPHEPSYNERIVYAATISV